MGKEYKKMEQVDILQVDRDSLVDIMEIQIDESLPREERFAEFLRQVKNPYCFRCGNMAVKISFADTPVSLEERLEHYFRTL